jgi:mRNA-degrading endonuclease RelE of RelBE toxin-antitoxin system
MYQIEFTKSALRDLEKLSRHIQSLIIEKLDILAQNPDL